MTAVWYRVTPPESNAQLVLVVNGRVASGWTAEIGWLWEDWVAIRRAWGWAVEEEDEQREDAK